MEIEKPLHFDLFIVGGGPAGLTLAEYAAGFGLSIGLADKAYVGLKGDSAKGTTINLAFSEGPKKLMHFVSQLGDFKEDQRECGFGDPTQIKTDWTRLIQGMAKFAAHQRQVSHAHLSQKNVKIFAAHAKLLKQDHLELVLEDNQRQVVVAKTIVLASGASHAQPTFAGSEHVLEAEALFALPHAPNKCLIIGDDYQAIEMAGFVRGVGFEASVLHQGSIGSGLDSEMMSKMEQYLMTFSNISVAQGTVSKVQPSGGRKVVTWSAADGSELSDEFDTILFFGKKFIDGKSLGLENAGVLLGENGRVKVDHHFETSSKGVFAIGEVIATGTTFATVAAKQATTLVDGLVKHKWSPVVEEKIPKFLFTSIEYGFCGFSEEAAQAKFGEDNIDVFYANFKPLEWNFNERRKAVKCFTKVIHHNKDDRVLGIHYLGPNAAEIIQGFALVVTLGLKISAIQNTVGIHPTTAEEIVNLKLNKRFDDPALAAEEGC